MNSQWMFLFLICKITAELTHHDGIFQVDTSIKSIGRIKYRDGEVVLLQNQQKKTNFFFAPFPYLQFEEVQCHENDFSDSVELALPVELYTPELIQTVKNYLNKYYSILCGNMHSTSLCDVSLLPMNSIRLIQKNSRLNNTRQKYTLEDAWQSTSLLLQSMEFVIYTSNITICEQLRKTLVEKCRLPNFEIHYTLQSEQTVQQQLEISTEHVANTSMFNSIRTQFPTADSVLLTDEDFKKLLSESTDQSTTVLRMNERFVNLQNSSSLYKLFEQHLSNKQIKLKTFRKKLWNDLYWNSDLTRPDLLAKVLNSIIYKENDDSEHFVYNRQTAKNKTKNISDYDKQRFAQFDRSIVKQNQTDEDKNKQYIIDRQNVEKLLQEFFNSVYLADDMIQPRSLHTRLIQLGKISTRTKLFSYSILVRIRPHIYVLPLRCKPDENGGKSKVSLLERIERLESTFNNLSNHSDMDYTRNQKNNNLLKDYLNMNLAAINQNINNISNRIDQLDDYMKTNIETINNEIALLSNQSNTQNDIPSSSTIEITLNTWNPTFQRPGAEQQGTYYYGTIDFRVTTSDTIWIFSQSSLDTYGIIYQDSFDATSPDTNLVVQDDESQGSTQFQLQTNLMPETNYTLVVTTYEPDVTGTVTIYATSGFIILAQTPITYETVEDDN